MIRLIDQGNFEIKLADLELVQQTFIPNLPGDGEE